jgi:TonB family protein
MLFHAITARRTISFSGWLLSLLLHAMVIVVLILHRPQPMLLHEMGSLRGVGGGGRVIALAISGVSAPETNTRESQEIRKHRLPPRSRRRAVKPAEAPPAAARESLLPGMPGFVLGSLSDGFASDHDIRVAVSVVAPEPPIDRAKLPRWINGDVVVEVTISEKGDVIQTRVLKSVGFGLDEIVVETLRQWHYIPARIDGLPVASREDVHFHFPT